MKKYLFLFAALLFLIQTGCAGKMTEESAAAASQEKAGEADNAETGLLKETDLLAEEDQEKAFENVIPSAVMVQVNGHHGSGSIWEITDQELIIVTNRHVLEYFDDDSNVTFFNGSSKDCSLLYMSEKADVGFLSVGTGQFTKKELAQLRTVCKDPSAYEKLKKDSTFFMIDLWEEEAPACRRGSVQDKQKFLEEFDEEMLYGDGEAVPGMSGCGIFDFRGNYIGMLSGATEHYEIAGVPLETIQEEYDKIMIK